MYAVLKETLEDVKPRKPWLINKSVFEPRRRESDARAYLDTSAVEKAGGGRRSQLPKG